MKKFLALLCTLCLVMTVTGAALANPSIQETSGAVDPNATVAASDAQGNAIADATVVTEVAEIAADDTTVAAPVKAVVAAVNDPNAGISVAELATQMNEAADATVADVVDVAKNDKVEKADPKALENYYFVTKMNELAVVTTDNVAVEATDITVTLVFDSVAQGSTDTIYKILLIHPATSQTYIITPDAVDYGTGKVTVTFPFVGYYALIQQLPEA